MKKIFPLAIYIFFLAGSQAWAAASLVFVGASTPFGGVAVGSSKAAVVYLYNGGNVAATDFQAEIETPFRFKGESGFPGEGGSCGSTLAPKASCKIVLTFAPTAEGNYGTTLNLQYFDGGETQLLERPLSGTGLVAQLTVSGASTIDFGTLGVSQTRDITLTVKNASAIVAASSLGVGGAFAGSGVFSSNGFTLKSGGLFPGLGGTCGTTLAPKASCTMVFRFSPPQEGAQSALFTLRYWDGASNRTVVKTLAGTGAVAVLGFSISTPHVFPTTGLGLSRDVSFTVSNANNRQAAKSLREALLAEGGSPLSGNFRFKGGSYPGTGGTCSTTLDPSKSCTLIFTFTPTAPGAVSDTFSLSYNDGLTTRKISRALQGTGAAVATLDLGAPASFPLAELFSASSLTFFLKNIGGSPATSIGSATFVGPFAFKGGQFPGTGGNCTNRLEAKQLCTLVVSFTPTLPTNVSGSLSLAYQNGVQGRTTVKTLSGVAKSNVLGITLLGGGAVTNFPNAAIGGETSYTFTIKNNGTLSLGFSGAQSFLDGRFDFGGSFPGPGGTCSTAVGLAPNRTCTIVVFFKPQDRGAHAGQLNLAYKLWPYGSLVYLEQSVQGNGINPARLTFSKEALQFSTIKSSQTTTEKVLVTNDGEAPAGGIYQWWPLNGSQLQNFNFTPLSHNCPDSLNAGASCELVYRFNPASGGLHTAFADVSYFNGAYGDAASIELSGTAIASAVLNSSARVDFDKIERGGIDERTVTLTNVKDGPATAMTPGAVSGPFTYKGGVYPGTGGTCSNTLAAGATCTLVIEFAPATVDTFDVTWTITYNDGSDSKNLSFAISGESGAGLARAADFGVSNDGSFSTVRVTADDGQYQVKLRLFNAAHEVVNTVTVLTRNTAPVAFAARSRVSQHTAVLVYSGAYVWLSIYDNLGNNTSGLKTFESQNYGYTPGLDIADDGKVAVHWRRLNNNGYNTYLVSPNGTTLDRSSGLTDYRCYTSGDIAFNKATGSGVATCQGSAVLLRRFDASGNWVGGLVELPNNIYTSYPQDHFVGVNDYGEIAVVTRSSNRWIAALFDESGSYVAQTDLGYGPYSSAIAHLNARIISIGHDFVIPWTDDVRKTYFGHFRVVHPDGVVASSFDAPSLDGMHSLQIDGNNKVYYISRGLLQFDEFSIAP